MVPSLALVSARIPPIMCGIGDYSWLLGNKISELCPEVVVRFVVTDPCNHDAFNSCEGSPTIVDPAEEMQLRDHLECNASAVLFQFAQYDYDDRGNPEALVNALVNWRSPRRDRRLIVMVHELWLPALARRREVLHYPGQLLTARRLFRAADSVFVNNRCSADKAGWLRGRPVDQLLPISSNFGEPSLDPLQLRERDSGHGVIFGSAGRIIRSLKSFIARQEMLSAAGFAAHLSIVGGKESHEVRELQERLAFPSVYFPDLPHAEVSALLMSARWSYIDYPDLIAEPTLLFKSTVFAACLSHGVIPVLPNDLQGLCNVGEPVPRTLCLDRDLVASLKNEDGGNATSNRHWYDRHMSLRCHALANLKVMQR